MVSVQVISASYDKQIRFWDAVSGRTIRCFTFQDSQINALLLVKETNHLAVAGFGVLRLYDMWHGSSAPPGGAASPSGGTTGGAPGMAVGGAGAAAPPNANAAGGGQAPPLFSSFESAGSMNFTSIGSFPLLPRGDHGSLSSEYESQLTNSQSNIHPLMLDPLAGTIAALTVAALEQGGMTILYATSEDGHVRFFDARSAPALRVLKDISTGAAITCSCLSPDRRILLTGNQMGQVSVWHLPSIVSSIVGEQQQTQQAQPHAPEGGAQVGEEDNTHCVSTMQYGSRPLQDIAFPGDYTAIRSIAIEPLARWAVVATNAGKLHFLRFSTNAKLFGSKSVNAVPGGMTRLSPSPIANPNDDTASSILRPGNEGVSDTASSIVHRESIYRSALVINELSVEHARRNSSISGAAPNSGGIPMGRMSPFPNGIGSALLDSIEQRQSNSMATDGATRGTAPSVTATSSVGTAGATATRPPTPLEELEMEVFHSFQAHYKYILKVAIAPNGELLMTCSADYTVGRFQVPWQLQVTTALSTRERTGSLDHQEPLETAVGSITTLQDISIASTQAPTVQRLTAEAVHQPPSANTLRAAESGEPGGSSHHLSDTCLTQTEHTKSEVSAHEPSDRASKPEVSANGDIVSQASSIAYFKPLKPLSGHNRWVWDCVFSDCCRFLFTASSDSHIRMWNGLTSDRPQSTSFMGHTKPVVAVLLYYDRRR